MNKQKLIVVLFLFFLHSFGFAFVSGQDRFEFSIGADIPVYTGGHLRYNWSTNWYSKLGAGFAIELMMNTHQQILNKLGFPKQTQLLSSALVNSVMFDVRIGWAKSIYEGPYMEAGYQLMIWGTGKVKGSQINSFIGETKGLVSDSVYQVDVLNHGPALHLGYRFILVDKLTLNTDLGVYKPLFSDTKLNYQKVTVPKGAVKKVNDILVEKLWFLSLGVWFSLSF